MKGPENLTLNAGLVGASERIRYHVRSSTNQESAAKPPSNQKPQSETQRSASPFHQTKFTIV